jgi:hypothetical protein
VFQLSFLAVTMQSNCRAAPLVRAALLAKAGKDQRSSPTTEE